MCSEAQYLKIKLAGVIKLNEGECEIFDMYSNMTFAGLGYGKARKLICLLT